MGPTPRHIADRLADLSMPEPNSGCVLWLAHVNRKGYGQFSFTRTKKIEAHRAAYLAANGQLPPEGMQLDHLCRVRCCINVAHLEVVPPRTNYLRGESFVAQKARQTHCLRGHALSGENLRIDNKGHRQCRQCIRARKRR